MLVGREVLLQAGDRALRDALTGRGRLLLLTGEAGIGKTSLALALADRGRDAGAQVRVGACWESERLPPFTPWLDVLQRPGDDACVAAARGLEGAGGHDSHDASDASRARGRRFADVVDALRAAAADRPQVVVLEDLHWADGESLELLLAMAAHVTTMSVLLVGTYRDDELSPAALASIGGNADRLALGGLDDEAVALVLESVLGRPSTDRERAAIQRQTGGNPLFVTQVGRLLDSGAPALPSGVRDVLARRLARTSTACDRVLGAASVLGVEFDQVVLEAVLGGPVAAELDEAVAARLITPCEDEPARWRFVHSLVQATRYELLAGPERARLHREAVSALQRPGSKVPPASLAHHALRGSFAPDDPAPSTLLTAAGSEALARLAWPDALAAFDRAVSLAPPGAGGAPARAEAWLGIGAARLRQGKGDARAAFDEAASLGRQTGRADLIARSALGFSVGLGAFEVRMLDHRQIELLEEAADVLDANHRLLPLVLARLSVALAFVDSSERRIELANRAVDLARRGGDPVVLGHALAAWCDALADPDHVEQRLDASAEAIVLGQRAGDLPLELLGRRLRVVALLELSDLPAVQLEIAAYERGAFELNDPLYMWFGSLWRATLAATEGRTVDAQRLLDEATELGALGGSTNSRLLAEVSGLMTAIDRRDRSAADRSVAAMLAVVPGLVTPYADITHAYIDAALGDIDRARFRLSSMSSAHLDELPRDSEWVCAMVQAGYAAARAGVHELIPEVRLRLEPAADCAAVEGIGAYLHGSVHRFLGLLAAAEADLPSARLHVAAARAAVAGGGAVLQALTDLDGAWALARSDDPSDLAHSVVLAGRAEVALSAVGMARLAAEAGALRRTGRETASPESDGDARTSTSVTRIGDSWAWSFDGHTVHIRHAKGVADLALLLERQGREVHVRELAGVTGMPTGGSSHQAVLDEEAVQRYRQRLVDLEDDLDEAERHGDVGRAGRLAAERDAVVDQLTAAFGVGGRARRVGSDPDERLRKAVSARVRASIDRIEALHPALGRHLRTAIHTGFWCSYQPEHPIEWSVVRS